MRDGYRELAVRRNWASEVSRQSPVAPDTFFNLSSSSSYHFQQHFPYNNKDSLYLFTTPKETTKRSWLRN